MLAKAVKEVKAVAASNTEVGLKKICIRKCKKCLGLKCPNYLGQSREEVKRYYSGVLHSRKVRFVEDRRVSKIGRVIIDDGRVRPVQESVGMDKLDWGLVYGLIGFVGCLTVFGGLI